MTINGTTRLQKRINSSRPISNWTREEREELYAEFQRMYDVGMSDMQMAEEVGCCDATPRRWRWRNSLPNIFGVNPPLHDEGV